MAASQHMTAQDAERIDEIESFCDVRAQRNPNTTPLYPTAITTLDFEQLQHMVALMRDRVANQDAAVAVATQKLHDLCDVLQTRRRALESMKQLAIDKAGLGHDELIQFGDRPVEDKAERAERRAMALLDGVS